MVSIFKATTHSDFIKATDLFNEYSSWCRENFIKYDLFQDQKAISKFNEEQLPGIYNSDRNFILLLSFNNDIKGCVFLKELNSNTCEMKRLYIVPSLRSLKLGRHLVEELMICAKSSGYEYMRITSHYTFMKNAVDFYLRYGFYEIEPYLDDSLQAGDVQLEYKLI